MRHSQVLGRWRAWWVAFALSTAAATSARAAPSIPGAPPDPGPAPGSSVLPAPPDVDDAQLVPPPEAPRVLASWEEALELVRAQSPDYLTTYDNVLRAEAQARVALAAILPNINAQGSFTHQLITTQASFAGTPLTLPLQDVWAASATAVWNIGNPRGIYGVGTADRNAEAAKMDLAEKRRTIAQGIVGAMLATLAAERLAELHRVGLRASLARLGLAQTRTRMGSGTELDVDRAQQDVAAARAQIISGDESLRQTRESLGLALGLRVAIAAPGNLDLAEFEGAVAATCHFGDDVDRRPDVLAAKERVLVAERLINDVSLQFSPSITLASQAAWASQALFGPSTTWNVQAVLNVPIWDGGARYGFLREARATADQARQALVTARLNALINVTQSVRAVSVTAASRDVTQQQRDLAFRVDQRTRAGYLHGLGTSLDLVTSAQALRQAEINLALLQFQASRARVVAILSSADCMY